MADNESRILELPEQKELDAQDYFAVDRPSGTRRVSAGVVEEYARKAVKDSIAGTDVKKYLTNCVVGSRNGILAYSLGEKANYTIVGKPNIVSDVISGGDANNKITLQIDPNSSPTKSFLAQVKIHTDTTHGSGKGVLLDTAFGFSINIEGGIPRLWLSTNGTSHNLANNSSMNRVLPTNSDVWLRLKWDGRIYTFSYSLDGENFETCGVIANDSPIKFSNGLFTVYGNHAAVDLKETFIKSDGEFIYNGGNVEKVNLTASENGLVVSNGMVSGFSADKFMLLPKSCRSVTKSFEAVIKWMTGPALSTYQHVLGCATHGGPLVRTHANGHIYMWMGTAVNSWGIFNEFDTGLVVEPNKTYWFKLLWDGSLYTPALSQDGVNFVAGKQLANETAMYWDDVCLGVSAATQRDQIQQGAIDLAGCYVKIDGAVVFDGANVYNQGAELQDGVASGFSPFVGVPVGGVAPLTSDNNFLYQVKLHTPATRSAAQIIFGGQSNASGAMGSALMICYSTGRIYLWLDTAQFLSNRGHNITNEYQLTSNAGDWIVPTDTDVWIRLIRIGARAYLPQISYDGINFKSGRLLSSTSKQGKWLPYLATYLHNNSQYFQGSIDLKETFFKCDGDFNFTGANVITLNDAVIEDGILKFPVPQNQNGAFIPTPTPADSANSWELTFGLHTGPSGTIGNTQCFQGVANGVRPDLYITDSKFSMAWGNTRVIFGSNAVLPNTDYWVRLVWNGAQYDLYSLVDDGSFTLETLPDISEWSKEGASYAQTTDLYKDILISFGFNTEAYPWKGSIDLSKCLIKRNGATWWAWNGQSGDNFDLTDYAAGWVYNGESYGDFRLENGVVWKWNGKSTQDTQLDDGAIWELEPALTGSITEKAGVRALLGQGQNEDGSVENLEHVCDKDTNVQIPYIQSGDFAAYLDTDEKIKTEALAEYNLAPKGIRLCDFTLEDYVITDIRNVKKVAVLQLHDSLADDTRIKDNAYFTLINNTTYRADTDLFILVGVNGDARPTNGMNIIHMGDDPNNMPRFVESFSNDRNGESIPIVAVVPQGKYFNIYTNYSNILVAIKIRMGGN